MAEEGDRILTVVGVVLVVALVAALGIAVLAATSAPARESSPPDANWTLDRVNDSHVRITHDGGEPVPAAELVVMANRYERDVSWTGLVGPSDSGVVRVGEQQKVRLIWDGGRAEQRQLAAWEVDRDAEAARAGYSEGSPANSAPGTVPTRPTTLSAVDSWPR